MADYKIQVGIDLDVSNLQQKINDAVNKQKFNVTAALNIDMTNYQKMVGALGNTVRVNVDDKQIKELESNIGNITKEISIFNGKGIQTGFVENLNTGLGKSQQNIYSLNQKTNELQLSVAKLSTDYAAINREKEKELKLTAEITAKQNQLNSIVEKLKLGAFGSADISAIDEISKKINNVSLTTKSSIQELSAFQKELGKIVSSSKLGEIKPDSGLSFKSSQAELQNYLQTLFGVEKQFVQIKDKVKTTTLVDGEQWKQQTAIIKNAQGQWEKYVVSINSVSHALRIAKEGIVNVNSNLSNTEEILKARMQSKVDTFKSSLNSNIENIKIGGLSDADLQRVNSLQSEIQRLSADTKNAEQEMKRLGLTYKSLLSDLKSGRLVDSGNALGIKTSDAELRNYIAGLKQVDSEQVKIANSSRIAFGSNGEQIRIVNALVHEGSDTWRRYQYAMNTATLETRELDRGLQNVNVSQSRTVAQLKNLVAMYFSVTTAVRLLRQAMTEMKNADTELITIQKVSRRNAEEMNQLLQNSFAVATDYGRKSAEYLNAVSEFTKGGYGKSADELGRLSLLAQNAGDISSEQANKFLLAADAAWRLNGDVGELTKILDGFNDVANKNATDVGKLADGIRAAGSYFANAGLEVKDYAAIIGTATTVTQQTGDEMGRAWRTILMNIRQMKGETADGEIIDDKRLAKAEKSLKGVGVAVREYKNGINELRNPMSVLEELAAKWSSLNSVQQSMISESLAGKMRANALIAVMDNWDKVTKMVGEYETASGSAMRENEIYINSWQAKLNQLEAAWVKFVAKTVDSSWIKSIANAGIGLLDVLGSLGNAVMFLVGTFMLLRKNSIEQSITSQIRSFKDLYEIVAVVVTGNLSLATSEKSRAAATQMATASTIQARIAAIGFGTALNMALGVVGIAITVFSLLKMGIDSYSAAQEEARQKAIEHANALNQEKAAIDELAVKYAEISQTANLDGDARKQLLDIQNTLIEQYGIEAGSIDLVNGKYDENIKKINELRIAKLQAIVDENRVNAEKSQTDISKDSRKAPELTQDNYGGVYIIEPLFGEKVATREYIATLEDMRKRLNDKTGEFADIVQYNRESLATDINKRILKAQESLSKNQETVETVKNAMTEINKITIASANNFSKEQEELFRLLSTPVELDITNETEFTDKLNGIANEIKAIPVEKFNELKLAYINYQKAIATGDDILLEGSMQQIRDLKREMVGYSTDAVHFKKALNDIFDISQYDNEVKTLNESIRELKSDLSAITESDPLYEGIQNKLNFLTELKNNASGIFGNSDAIGLVNIDKIQLLSDYYNNANEAAQIQIREVAELGAELNNIDNSMLIETLDLITNGVTADNILKISIEEISGALRELQIDTTMFDSVTSSILDLKTGFENGKISADEFFNSINQHISNVDFGKMFGGDTASIQKYFTALSSEVSSGFEKVINQFNAGQSLASDYAKSLASTAQSYSSLVNKLVEGNKVWGNNSSELEQNTAALRAEQAAIDDSVDSLSAVIPALEAIEQVSTDAVTKGSEEWENYYKTISDTLVGIVADSETMLYDVNGNLLTTSNQIYNALVNNTLSFETASETIIGAANENITTIGMGIGKFLNTLGNEIKNFKFQFSITPTLSFSKDKISPLLPFALPEVRFDFKVTDSGSIGNIFDAFSSFVTESLPKIDVDDLLVKPQEILDSGGGSGKVSKTSTPKSSGGSGSGSSGSKSSGAAKKEYEEVINFADKAIAEISQRITELQHQLENAVELDDKNTIIDAIITAQREKIAILQQAIDLYSSHAQKALDKIPKDLQKSVTEGSIDITTIKDENAKKAIDEYNKWSDASVKLKNEISGINKEIKNLNTEKFENLNKKFENSLKPLQDSISDIDYRMKLLRDNDYEIKINLINQQFEEQGKVLSRTSDELKNVQALYQSGVITAEQFKERTDSLTKAWQDGVITANGYTKAIQDILKAQAQSQLTESKENKAYVDSLVEMTKNLLKQQASDQIKAIQDEIDGYNDAKKALQEKGKELDKQLKAQKKIADAGKKALDDEIKRARELADAEKKRLNDKLKAYEKIISEAKKALDIEKEQHSYQNDLDSKQGDIANLENRIAELSNDTSRAAIAERQKLEEELANKRKELADFIYNNDIDKRKDALDAELQLYKDTINSELELNDEKLKNVLDSYDKQKEALNQVHELFAENVEREKELIEQQSAEYDRMAEDRKKQIDAIQERINNNANLTREAMQKIDSDGEKLYADLVQWNYEYGTGIERDVKDAWDDAKNVLMQYNSTLMATIQLTERISELNRQIRQMDSSSSGSYDSRNTVGVRQTLERAGYTVGWDDNSKSIIVDGKSYSSSDFQNINGTLYGSEDDIINMLKSLGLWRGSLSVGGKIFDDGFAQVHGGEEVVPKKSVDKSELVVVKAVDALENFVNLSASFGDGILDKLKSVINPENSFQGTRSILSDIQSSRPIENSIRQTEIRIDAPVTIEGNITENALPNLKKILDTQKREIVGEITKNLFQGGVRASVKSFSQ